MKTHTFFMSTKGIAIVTIALSVSGLLTFVSGVFLGIGIQRNAAPGAPSSSKGTAPSQVTASIAGVEAAAPGAQAPAGAWPFADPNASLPAPDPEPVPAPAAPVAPAPKAPADTARGRRATSSNVSLRLASNVAAGAGPAAAPEHGDDGDDDATYIVQVGQFRMERNAQALAARLEQSGFHPQIVVRDEGGKPVHVVRIGRIIGHIAAERVAEKVGDAERLIAVVTTDSGR